MLDILNQAQENDVAVSGLWIQDWSGKITTEFGTRFYKVEHTKFRLTSVSSRCSGLAYLDRSVSTFNREFKKNQTIQFFM